MFPLVAFLWSSQPRRAISSGAVPASMVRLPGLPSVRVVLSRTCYRYYARLGCPPGREGPPFRVSCEHPRRASPVPRSDYLCVPFPIRRGVLGGCKSKVFPTSLAFVLAARTRLSLVPHGCPLGLTSRRGRIRVML